MQKIKFNQLNFIKLKNKTYIPFQLHQLPKKYTEIPLEETFSLKGYCYINKEYLKESDYKYVTFNRDLDYVGRK
jgi:hypothetical protein|tara:strand:+ start:207 stop:428 length:222 start_codon:yes stop_codon:yes gene_type:complete